jgi:hypothetical protein
MQTLLGASDPHLFLRAPVMNTDDVLLDPEPKRGPMPRCVWAGGPLGHIDENFTSACIHREGLCYALHVEISQQVCRLQLQWGGWPRPQGVL